MAWGDAESHASHNLARLMAFSFLLSLTSTPFVSHLGRVRTVDVTTTEAKEWRRSPRISLWTGKEKGQDGGSPDDPCAVSSCTVASAGTLEGGATEQCVPIPKASFMMLTNVGLAGLPTAIDIEKVVEARAFEIRAMQTAMKTAR